MAEETETTPERETVDENGRIRNPMSPAVWTADEQPGVVQTEPEPKPPEPAPKTKKAA